MQNINDNLRIDSHKLIYHPERVNDWLIGKNIYPIYMEISPSGGCNHRCIFCAKDYLKYKRVFLDTSSLKKTIKTASHCGVKSIMFAGEGEPLLHKDIAEIIEYTKLCGIDSAVTTNGVKLSGELAKKILPHLSWIRISLDAASAKTYMKIHRAAKEDFNRVLDNLSTAVVLKRRNKYPVTIGVQFLLIKENSGEEVKLAEKLRDLGVDYLIIKPYSKHLYSHSKVKDDYRYENCIKNEDKFKKLENDSFKIYLRKHTMMKLKSKRRYAHCLGLPFWAYLDAEGNFFACSSYLGRKEFNFGNIYKSPFKDIFNSLARRRIIKYCATNLNTYKCRKNCRLDEINTYLWELKYPAAHFNFI
ncbi:MAG: radical SAM protein [Candidatus Omnitrophica bacterium]|nr:radical SAM protein [Candidatus Omnitrophota bacterium]